MGFSFESSFPTQRVETLGQGIKEILATFDSLAPSIPLGPVMFYRYDVWPLTIQGSCCPKRVYYRTTQPGAESSRSGDSHLSDTLPLVAKMLGLPLLTRKDPAHVFKQHEEMHRVRRGGDEIEFQVKAPRFFVLRMYRESTYASNIGRLQRAQHR